MTKPQQEAPAAPQPPLAIRRPHRVTVHGVEIEDPYNWMRERGSSEVLAYLEAENTHTAAVMAGTEPLQERLYQEMVARIQETDSSVPVERDGYYYYTRTEQGKQYAIHCRKRGSIAAPEQILLDVNHLAEGLSYFRLGAMAVSPDHRYLAYSGDTDGSERYRLHVKDLESGELMLDTAAGLADSLEWSEDGRFIFYTVRDETLRPYRLCRHAFPQATGEDALVYEEPDPAFFVGLRKTKSRRFLALQLHSNTTTEVHLLPAAEPEGEFRLVQPRESGHEYDVEDHEGELFILSNDGAVNFKLARAPLASPGKENWRDFIPHREAVKLEHIEVFRRNLAVFEREGGLTHIRVLPLEHGCGEDHRISFEEPVFSVHPGPNPDYESGSLRFGYTSLVQPDAVYDYDMGARERRLLKEMPVRGGYDKSRYVSERIEISSHDGVAVPVSLVYRKDLRRPGGNPCLLYGYGSYGISIDPEFSSTRLSLLDRGFVFAIAHIRGGGDLGRPWYEAGKLLQKRNTFLDFIASAEGLIERGYTRPEYLAVYGGSAGGLLIGAVINMRPGLFQAAVAKVPFVDVINTMLDPTIPLTVIEYEEWGNPQDEAYFNAMRAYAPYENVRAADYPHLLITGGLNDPRVQYWEPAKWAAKLRAMKTDGNLLLLKMHMGAGHSGASGRYDYLKELAFEYAFIFKCIEPVCDGELLERAIDE